MIQNELYNVDGEMSLLGVRDITKLKHTQQSLENKVLELKTRNDELDAFAYTVAHDLKNPISNMIGFASLIDQYYDRMSNDDIRENVRAIIESGQRMETIVNALLLLARVEHAIDAEITSLDMRLIIEQVKRSLNTVIRERSAQIHFPEDWPTARGYAPWVEAVWMNYISNAIKYGGRPPVIRLGADTNGNGHVHFWVQDNGRGLSNEEQQRIFRPFVRLTGDEVEGNGLGLTVVLKIMKRLEGNISVESEVGKGSRFGFTLPLARLSLPHVQGHTNNGS